MLDLVHLVVPQKRRPGRPRTGKVRLQLKLTPRARDLVRLRADKLGISHSEYVERVILEAEKWEQLRELMSHPARGRYPQSG